VKLARNDKFDMGDALIDFAPVWAMAQVEIVIRLCTSCEHVARVVNPAGKADCNRSK